jgi:hypothetical protein
MTLYSPFVIAYTQYQSFGSRYVLILNAHIKYVYVMFKRVSTRAKFTYLVPVVDSLSPSYRTTNKNAAIFTLFLLQILQKYYRN